MFDRRETKGEEEEQTTTVTKGMLKLGNVKVWLWCLNTVVLPGDSNTGSGKKKLFFYTCGAPI